MTFDRPRLLRCASLAAWAAFFIYLIVSNERLRYIGPRTQWVIEFGAIVLSVAALAHLPFLRSGHPREASRKDGLGALVVIAPILLTVVVPAPELGSLAASRKSGTTGLTSAIAFAPPSGDREVSFIDFHYANLSEDYATQAGLADGMPLELTGFITHEGGVGLQLTRFYISCCAADAIPYSVPLDAGGDDFPDDTWLRVEGTVRRTADRYVLEAEEITEIETPEDPYLS